MALPGLSAHLSGKVPPKHDEKHDTPKRDAVREEAYVSAETNIPYRGSVDHGAPLKRVEYNPELDPWKDDNVPVEAHIDPVTPVPVYIVSDGQGSGSELKQWRVLTGYAPATATGTTPAPVQIIGRHDVRTAIKIKNLSDDVAWIGHDQQSARPGFGWPLAKNETAELTSTQEVWAVGAGTTNPSVLAIMEQFTVDVP